MWTRQPSCSELEGQSSVPSASRTGLARIGPRIPSGRRWAFDHVFPPSPDFISIPHQRDGVGPTL